MYQHRTMEKFFKEIVGKLQETLVKNEATSEKIMLNMCKWRENGKSGIRFGDDNANGIG